MPACISSIRPSAAEVTLQRAENATNAVGAGALDSHRERVRFGRQSVGEVTRQALADSRVSRRRGHQLGPLDYRQVGTAAVLLVASSSAAAAQRFPSTAAGSLPFADRSSSLALLPTSATTVADAMLLQRVAPNASLPQACGSLGATPISLAGVLISAAPLLAVAAIGAHLRLGLNRDLAIGAVRCIAQLSAVGFVLGPIFHADSWSVTVPYILAMCSVAAIESISRPKHGYPGMLPQVFMALGISSASLVTFGLSAIIPTRPAFDARYLIPMLGMLLGSSCSSVAVGLSAALEDLSLGANKVEALLAMGASRTEATRHVVRRGVRMALIQLVNTLNVTGIVVIPGMMTGQILGGSDPVVASRYQIVIFFLMAASTAMSATATVYSAVFTIVGAHHSLHAERITAKKPARDALVWAGMLAGRAATRIWASLASLPWPWQHDATRRGFTSIERAPLDDVENNYEMGHRRRPSAQGVPAHGAQARSILRMDDLQGSFRGPRTPSRSITSSRISPVTEISGEQPIVFSVDNLHRRLGDRVLHDDVSFSVRSGDVLFVTGPSGCGKTKLLRSLAALEEIDGGGFSLDAKTPRELGWPAWRSLVGYAFQQSVPFGDLPDAGTPALLFDTVKAFTSQRGRRHLELPQIARSMGLEDALLHREWKSLSGGQAQRAQLAVLVALKPAVLLLDEPTSALDSQSAMQVEQALKSSGAALIWVSHDPNQPARVGGRVLKLPEGTLHELA